MRLRLSHRLGRRERSACPRRAIWALAPMPISPFTTRIKTSLTCSPIHAMSSRAARSSWRKANPAIPRVDRRLLAAGVPTVLHHVVRQLSGGREPRARDETRGESVMISLSLKEHPTVPLEAECISPDVMANLFEAELAALPVFLGKRRHNLADFFTISGSGSDEIELNGDAGRVKWVGKGMTRGRIAVRGNVGMHLGAYMSGGRIDVSGDAGDWVGGEMKGGLIHIRGSAGGQLGAAYRGSITGLDG